jgi:DNA-binding response OmpR family regulator
MVYIANILIISANESQLMKEHLHAYEKFFNIITMDSIKEIEKKSKEMELLILDCEGLEVEGIEFIQYLRGKGIESPLIFLTKNRSEEEIEKGFTYGADDHIRKPYHFKELLYRSKALLRRTHGLKHEQIIYRDLVLNCNTRQAYVEGREIQLTKQKFDLLKFFIEHKKIILEREYILKSIWKDETTQKRTVNVTMKRLIEKIDPENKKNYFSAIRSIGYRLN